MFRKLAPAYTGIKEPEPSRTHSRKALVISEGLIARWSSSSSKKRSIRALLRSLRHSTNDIRAFLISAANLGSIFSSSLRLKTSTDFPSPPLGHRKALRLTASPTPIKSHSLRSPRFHQGIWQTAGQPPSLEPISFKARPNAAPCRSSLLIYIILGI